MRAGTPKLNVELVGPAGAGRPASASRISRSAVACASSRRMGGAFSHAASDGAIAAALRPAAKVAEAKTRITFFMLPPDRRAQRRTHSRSCHREHVHVQDSARHEMCDASRSRSRVGGPSSPARRGRTSAPNAAAAGAASRCTPTGVSPSPAKAGVDTPRRRREAHVSQARDVDAGPAVIRRLDASTPRCDGCGPAGEPRGLVRPARARGRRRGPTGRVTPRAVGAPGAPGAGDVRCRRRTPAAGPLVARRSVPRPMPERTARP